VRYIVEVELNKIEDVKSKFNVLWESDVISGLLAVEAECIYDLVGVDGIKRIEKTEQEFFM